MAERKYYVLCSSNCKFESMTKEQILTAIQQAVSTGEIADVDTGFITTIKEQNRGAGLSFWVGTTAQYNAITEKAEDCFYILTDDTKDADTAKAISELREEIESILTLVNNQAPYIVTFSGRTYPESADKTFDEIYQAITAGKSVIGRHAYSTGYEYYQLTKYTETRLSFAYTNNVNLSDSVMTDQYTTKLVQIASDGTFTRKTFTLPQKDGLEYFSADEALNLITPYDELYEFEEYITQIRKRGNKVFADITINAKGEARNISAKGTTSDLRGINTPIINVNNIVKPLEGTGVIQGFVYYKDIDRTNTETTAFQVIPVNLVNEGNDEYVIHCNSNYIYSKSAIEVEYFTFSCMWITEE